MPPVSSSTAFVSASPCAATVWVAPKSRAQASFFGTMSAAMIVAAPHRRAPCCQPVPGERRAVSQAAYVYLPRSSTPGRVQIISG